ncbi:aldo/keto reductase [Marinitenerispora sediminis]|uniref:Oxidoreductase n=1 Tax=Marinitenerispora sediminis TaxID=1931232 RepID=A0A368T5P2_9ACTN|nr:aldo/keto reductase [Marinitenerispora sediminis]RCV50692.1 oxidoreductase [Marinitenerispora sediminis]RCV56367.1 oxidoreductase [Marinitenerispora sediminis]RCV58702.1 oxidoreductase [Marinitenerispora sediminis]
MTTVPDVTLNNGVRIPQLGFGVWQVDNSEVVEPVRLAIEAGYRSIDTAAVYGNEQGVGEAIRQSGVARDDLFVTSKLWNSDQGYDSTLRAFDATLERLGLEQLDLYLIHWPLPARDTYIDTWKAFERLYADGRVRAIGLSNFQIPHLRRVLDEGSVVPAINQIELHPNLVQAELRAFHAEHGIATEAWSPLGQGHLLTDPAIGEIAESYGKTAAQVILRWHLQLGNVVIPKSVTPERIRSNFDVFDFELSAADVEALSALDAGKRFGPDPDVFGAV